MQQDPDMLLFFRRDPPLRQIEAAGYRILRFWNNDVLGNLEGVLSEIQRALPPTPDPSPQGGGEPRQRAKRAPRRSRRERN